MFSVLNLVWWDLDLNVEATPNIAYVLMVMNSARWRP